MPSDPQPTVCVCVSVCVLAVSLCTHKQRDFCLETKWETAGSVECLANLSGGSADFLGERHEQQKVLQQLGAANC